MWIKISVRQFITVLCMDSISVRQFITALCMDSISVRQFITSQARLIYCCYDAEYHMLWSLFIFCKQLHGNLHQSLLTMSRVTCFIPRAHMGTCVGQLVQGRSGQRAWNKQN